MGHWTKREVLASGAALGAMYGGALASQRYSSPGVYVTEVTSPGPRVSSLPTSETVLVTAHLASGKPALVRFMAELDGLVRPEGRVLVNDWASSFFRHGGRNLYLWPARSGDGEGLVGAADDLTGLRGLGRAGQLWSRDWPGGARPLPVGLIIVPEAAGLAADAPEAATFVYRTAAEVAEGLRAMALIDTPPVIGGVPFETWTAARDWRSLLAISSGHAALYGNVTENPRTGLSGPISPLVAGVIAKTDAERGVWKAPAGVDARLQRSARPSYTSAEAQELNADGVNTVLMQPTVGAVVWGARTLSSSGEDRFIPVRRLRDHVVQSLRWSLQILAVEDNAPATWTAAREAADTFLMQFFRQGALQGAAPRDAYFVKCGLGETMSQADVDGGRMILTVGLAPLRPAEFVVENIIIEGLGSHP